MRRFLAWTLILTTAIALTFVVAKLIGVMEVITVSASGEELVELGDNTVYTDVGESFFIEINQSNKNPNTKVKISSDNESIIKANEDGSFTAVSGGHTVIRITTTNIYFRNLTIEVFVGDGSNHSPYYIFNSEQLASIGTSTDNYANYHLYNSYRLIADIDVSDINNGLWRPLGAFSGNFDGNGYTIKNINIDSNQYNIAFGMQHNEAFINNGLFSKIEVQGAVYNLKIENFTATSVYETGQTTIGAITGINNGKVERIEVLSAKITASASYIGGVVGINASTEKITPTYSLHNARVDQVSANVSFGNSATFGIYGVIGGVVGKNAGGTVIYSYSVGEAYITNNTIYGGIIGENTFIHTSSNHEPAKLKDSYSASKLYLYFVSDKSTVTLGGVVGLNNNKTQGDEGENIIIGIYYNHTNLNIAESTVPNKDYVGVGKDIVDGDIIYKTESIGYIYAYTSLQLKTKNNLISHEKKEIIINSNNETIRENTVIIDWNFNNIWKIDTSTNNGYPSLRYLAINDINETDYTKYDDFTKVVELYLDEFVVTFGQVLDNQKTEEVVSIKVYNENDELIATSNNEYNLPLLSDATIINNGSSLMIYRNGTVIYKITAQPIDIGYSVIGWAKENGETNWLDAMEVKQNIYLNAKIEKVKVITTAIFNYYGATGPISLPAKSDYTYGEKYGLLPAPVKLGSWFEGWYLEPNYVTKVDELTIVTSSEKTHNLYAKWGTLEYTHYSIAYNANGGSGHYIDNVLMGDSYTILSNTATGIRKSGHYFLGWAVTANGKVAYAPGEAILPTANVSLYAVWELSSFSHSAVALRHNKSAYAGANLNAVSNGSSATFSITVNNKYKFIGWYSNPHYTEQQDLVSTSATYTTTLSSNLILYAYWIEKYSQICNTCGEKYDGERCPNERYCTIHRKYYHGNCTGKVFCSACGKSYQCGTVCPIGPINYCPQHGDYHGQTCPYKHSINCSVCGKSYYGDRCPNEKYCSEHRVYYHGSCNRNTYCSVCKAYYRCGVDCSRYHYRCYTCNLVYSGDRCPSERYCSIHGVYYHGNKCPISHFRLNITFYFRKR